MACSCRRLTGLQAQKVGVVVYFILSRLLYIAFFRYFRPTMHAASKHGNPGLTSLPKDGRVSCFGRSSGRSPSSF